jgi:hypothetical protein
MATKNIDAVQVCHRALGSIRHHLTHIVESCDLIEDESKRYFVFVFMRLEVDGVKEIRRYSVLKAMIEDGIMSEQQIKSGLWRTLGHIKGMHE